MKPDVPVAATSASMLANPAFNPTPLVAECHSDHPAGRWCYVVTMHCCPTDDPVDGVLDLADLDDGRPDGDVVLWDWRARTAERVGPDHRRPIHLGREDWRYLVLAPLLDSGMAVIGDVEKFVTAGDSRVGSGPSTGRQPGRARSRRGRDRHGLVELPPRSSTAPVVHDPVSGVWELTVAVPARGWTTVEVLAG